MATGVEFAPRQHETEQITAHVLWMTTGLSCEGDSVAMTSATNPSLEDIIQGVIPGMPRVVIHNQVIAFEVGDEYIQAWYDAEQGKLDPFVLVVEGSVGNVLADFRKARGAEEHARALVAGTSKAGERDSHLPSQASAFGGTRRVNLCSK